jgi:hypothetical protein
MNTLKKALCIGFGLPLFVLGLGGAVIGLFITNLSLGQKMLFSAAGLGAAFFGWWLVRRGSDSLRDAIDWIITWLIP